MNSMKLTVTIYQYEDGVYVAECPSVPGCESQGTSEMEAEANIVDALRQHFAARADLGVPLSVSTKEIDLSV